MGLRASLARGGVAAPARGPAAGAPAASDALLEYLNAPLSGTPFADEAGLRALLKDILDSISIVRENATKVRDEILSRAEGPAASSKPGVAEQAAKLFTELDAAEARKISALEAEAVAVEGVLVSVAAIREDASAAAAPARRSAVAEAARTIRTRVDALPPLPVAPMEPVVIALSAVSADDALGSIIAPRALAPSDIAAASLAPYALPGRDVRVAALELLASFPTSSAVELEVGAHLLMLHVAVSVELALPPVTSPSAVGAPAAAPPTAAAAAPVAGTPATPSRRRLPVKLTPALARRGVNVVVSVPLDAPLGASLVIAGATLGGKPLALALQQRPAGTELRCPVVGGGLRAPLRLPRAATPFPTSPCVSERGVLFAVATERSDLPVYAADGSALAPLPLRAAGVSRMACAAAFCDAEELLLVSEDDATDSRVYAFAVDAAGGVAGRSADDSGSPSDSATPAAAVPASPTLRWASDALGSDVLGLAVLAAHGLVVASLRRTDRLVVMRLSDGAVVAEARSGHPEQLAVDAASATVFVSVGMSAVEAFTWEEGAGEGGVGTLVARGRVAAAGVTGSYRPMAVLPPPPGASGGGGVLVVGTYRTRELRVLSLPDLALVQELTLGEAIQGGVTGLAGDPSGRALVVCSGAGSDAPIHVLPWPLQPEALAAATPAAPLTPATVSEAAAEEAAAPAAVGEAAAAEGQAELAEPGEPAPPASAAGSAGETADAAAASEAVSAAAAPGAEGADAAAGDPAPVPAPMADGPVAAAATEAAATAGIEAAPDAVAERAGAESTAAAVAGAESSVGRDSA